MNVFGVLLLASFAVIYTGAAIIEDENVLNAMTVCKDKEGASEDDFNDMKFRRPAVSHESKCMRACVLKHFKMLSDEGKLVKDVAIEIGKIMLNDEEKNNMVADVIEACVSIEVEDDHCEAGMQYRTCITQHAKEKGLDDMEL